MVANKTSGIFPLTFVISLRFFGLFIILPTISLHASDFSASVLWVGLAIGVAYFSQFIFQTPFGAMSDKYERNKVIIFGLLIFFVGSVICALANDIYTLTIGRALQGAGAIGGVVSAKISDLSPEDKRTKAMAMMGAGIFVSFLLAMILGPIIASKFGDRSLFALSAFLCLVSIAVMLKVPRSPKLSYDFEGQNLGKKGSFLESSTNKNLIIMNISAFLEKSFMTLTFVILPLIWVNKFGMDSKDIWEIYLPASLLGVVAMGPASIIAEKYNKPRAVMSGGVFFILISFALMAGANFAVIMAGVLFFFVGFATLEPIMQSLVSKYARAKNRGIALGNFTSMAYLGSFVGGFSGSFLYSKFSLEAIGIVIVLICIVWIISIRFLDALDKEKVLYIKCDDLREGYANFLRNDAVSDWYINQNEKILVVRYNTVKISERDIQNSLLR